MNKNNVRNMRLLVPLAGFILSDKGDHFKIYFMGNDLRVWKGKTYPDGRLKGSRYAYFLQKPTSHKRNQYHRKIDWSKQTTGKRLRRLESLIKYVD